MSRKNTTNIHFFITTGQRDGMRLINSKGERGLERGILHGNTENCLIRKGCAEWKTVKVRGHAHKRLFLTNIGKIVRKL